MSQVNEKISVVINTLNEEQHIENCIKCAQTVADEIIVCDMYSDDRTVEIAKQLGVKVIYHKRVGYVEPARLFAIKKASYNWILLVDADEYITEKLAKKFQEITTSETLLSVQVVYFAKLNYYFGGWVKYGGFFSNQYPRFFSKSLFIELCSKSDFKMIHNHGKLFESVKIENKLFLPKKYFCLHYAYPNIEKYYSKTLGKYGRIEAELRKEKHEKFRILKILFHPKLVFFKRFFLRGGYKDGIRGFIVCYLYSQYKFSIQANLWLLENKDNLSKKRQNTETDFFKPEDITMPK